MDPLIDDAEPARAFIELLKAVVERLRKTRSGNLLAVLGPQLQRDWSDWTTFQLGMTTAKFDTLLAELKRVAAMKETSHAEWPAEEAELRAAFVVYRAWWNAPRGTGDIAGTLRPNKAVEAIERRLETTGIELVSLREPEHFLALVNTEILGRSHAGDYNWATTTGQALAALLDRAPTYFGPIPDGRLAWMKGYNHFQLLFNGMHSGSHRTVQFALAGLAAADAIEDRAIRAMRVHSQNLIAERTGKRPDPARALAALALRSTEGSLPLLANLDRTIRRRATLALVHDGYPLDHKPDGDKTLEQLLIGYRDKAEKISAKPSLVVDNVGLMEVMLRHGRLGDAQKYHSQAYLALRNSKTPANMRLFEKATLLIEA